jgi:hypothetical protein
MTCSSSTTKMRGTGADGTCFLFQVPFREPQENAGG